MPKVKITEADNTSAVLLDSVSNVVYIPGLASTSQVKPFLCSRPSDLIKKDGLVKDGSYKLAYRLIQLGMQVLYEGVEASSAEYEDATFITNIVIEDGDKYFVVSGSDIKFYIEDNTVVYSLGESGETVSVDIEDGVATFSDIDTIIKEATFDFISGKVSYVQSVVASGSIDSTKISWSELEDLNKWNIRFLTTGAYATAGSELVECASKRGDCIALIDHPRSADTVLAVRNYIENVVGSYTEGEPASVNQKRSFCSAFTPWINLRLNSSDDKDITTLPGSAGYLLAYARSAQTNPNWYACAGSFRGVISELASVEVDYSKSECEQLQARGVLSEVDLDNGDDNVGIAINPIANIRPFGYIVWGNRTLIYNDGYTKATSFLNVRNLISTVKKELYFASNKYTFEQNSEVLWINFKSQITPLLDKMQSGNGVEGYKLVRQATDKKARLKARVVLVPIEAVEDFELEVSLEDSLEVVEQ